MIQYRLMEENDVKAVFELNQNCFHESWSFSQIREIIGNETMLYLVAMEQNELIGYCGLYQVLEEGNITQVAVCLKQRKKGIAGKMLQELTQLALQKGITFFTLEVRASNEAAIRLYEKDGYLLMGRRKNYYQNPTEDALIMNKEIKLNS